MGWDGYARFGKACGLHPELLDRAELRRCFEAGGGSDAAGGKRLSYEMFVLSLRDVAAVGFESGGGDVLGGASGGAGGGGGGKETAEIARLGLLLRRIGLAFAARQAPAEAGGSAGAATAGAAEVVQLLHE